MFKALTRQLPWAEGMTVGIKKLISLHYAVVKLHDCMVNSPESIPVCDEQTDRQMDRQTDRQAKLPMPMLRCRIAERDKKTKSLAN